MRPHIRLLALAALVLPAAALAGTTTTIFVSLAGVDSGGCGGTVGTPCHSIQYAYDNRASAGDEIRVAAGTYNECVFAIPFQGDPPKPVRIVAQDFLTNGNRATTIIDGTSCAGLPDAAVTLAGNGAELKGFTVRNGDRSGIFGQGGVAITNNIVTGNISDAGGGIFLLTANCYYGDTTSTIADNQLSNNSAFFTDLGTGEGGGIGVVAGDTGDTCPNLGDATVRIERNVVSTNDAEARGGGISILTNTEVGRSARVVVSRNTIDGNLASGEAVFGGGVFASTFGYGTETIEIVDNAPSTQCPQCGITDNTSDGDGGGLTARVDNIGLGRHLVLVENNFVSSNSAGGDGGGMDLFVSAQDLEVGESASLQALGNEVTDNGASALSLDQFDLPLGGGGILATAFALRTADLEAVRLSLIGNTITGNVSEVAGGGATLYVAAEVENPTAGPVAPALAHIDFQNNLVAGNSATDSTNLAEGGGVFVLLQAFGDALATAAIDFSTIVDNDSDQGGAGIELQSLTGSDTFGAGIEGEALLTVDHSIIADNTGGFGIGGALPGAEGPVTGLAGNGNVHALVSATDVFGNEDGRFEGTLLVNSPPPPDPPVLHEGTGSNANLNVDPQLDANGPDNILGTADDYAHGLCSRIGRASSSSLPDVNLDGVVDGIDILRISVAFGADPDAPRFTPLADLDGDGIIDGDDLALVASNLSDTCP